MLQYLWWLLYYRYLCFIFSNTSMTFMWTIQQILSWTWWTIQLHWRKFIVLILILWVWGWALTYSLTHYFSDLPLLFEGDVISVDPAVVAWKSVAEIWAIFQPAAITFTLVGVVAVVVLILVQIMVTKLSLDTKHTEVSKVVPFSLKKFFPYIWTSIFQSFLLFLLFLLLIVPGIIYSVYRLFTTIEVIASDNTYKKAMNTSKQMVSWRWRKTFGYLLVIILGVWLIQFIIVYVVSYIPDASITDALLSLISRVIQIFVMILMAHFYLVWKATSVSTSEALES
jgi:hypothetical protein